MNTKIVNLFAGPGAGKSTTAAGLFHRMKLDGYKVELVLEYAKDLTYEKRINAIACQPYVFGKQLMRLERVMGQVDYIVTDSPIFLSIMYNKTYPESFDMSVVDIFKSMNNHNFYINRKKEYVSLGRNQTENEAKALDLLVKQKLLQYNIDFTYVNGNEQAVDIIYQNLTIAQENNYETFKVLGRDDHRFLTDGSLLPDRDGKYRDQKDVNSWYATEEKEKTTSRNMPINSYGEAYICGKKSILFNDGGAYPLLIEYDGKPFSPPHRMYGFYAVKPVSKETKTTTIWKYV